MKSSNEMTVLIDDLVVMDGAVTIHFVLSGETPLGSTMFLSTSTFTGIHDSMPGYLKDVLEPIFQVLREQPEYFEDDPGSNVLDLMYENKEIYLELKEYFSPGMVLSAAGICE